jgi:hypothetical protein
VRSRSIRRRVAHLRKLGLEVMLTEIIPGGDDQLFSFHHRRRRKRQPAVPLCKAKTAPVSTWFCYHVEEWNPIVGELGGGHSSRQSDCAVLHMSS